MHETCTKTQCNPHRILWVVWPLIKPINQANVMTNLLSNSHSRYDVRLRHQNLTQFKTNIIVQTISDKHHSPTNPSLQNCLSKKKNNTSLSKGITPIIFGHCFQPTSAIPIHFSKKKSTDGTSNLRFVVVANGAQSNEELQSASEPPKGWEAIKIN